MSLTEVPKSKEKPTTEKDNKKKGKSNDEKFSIKSHINNGILKYQGKFKQAKVHTINRLVHKLKEPEKISKKVKNPEARIERYKNVLEYLKHTTPKRLGLLALHYYKSGKNYLANQDSTVEQLAVGYYSESKNLNVVLDAIREQLHIERNDKWKKATRKLFKKIEEKQISETKDVGDESMETDTVGDKNVKKMKNNSKKANKQEAATLDTEKQKKSKSKNAKTKFSDDENEVDEMKGTEAPTTVDDFFITADGSNYLSNAVVNSAQKDDNDTESKPFPPKKQSHEFIMNGGIGSGQSRKRFERNSGPKNIAGERRKWNVPSDVPVEVKEERKIDHNLHPSWIAKQKQKPTISEFKGTKITFD